MGYTVKTMAEKANLSPHVLRYYEKEGLLPHVKRTKGGNRHYSDGDLEWLGLVCCLKNTGMSIKQIREFVNLRLQGPETLKARCDMLLAHKEEVEKHIEEMNRHLEKVTHKIEHFTKQYEEYSSGEAHGQEAMRTWGQTPSVHKKKSIE
ncbi:MerR family transcriptional regulator [Anaerotalea alkaliphila]|uniref:MerR family transcriptional regulator n=1 Tax=Anaerotalea alkaliphila TaxID=2662126 RepID=A0A7X5HXM2_9FIRM|nr:MerR family transcriptional regulator [Anaerotalea alkaliphila]